MLCALDAASRELPTSRAVPIIWDVLFQRLTPPPAGAVSYGIRGGLIRNQFDPEGEKNYRTSEQRLLNCS